MADQSGSSTRVVAVITAKNDSIDELGAALAASVTGTRTEDGCVEYQLYGSLADPAVFVTVETWASQAHLDAHLSGPGIQGLLEKAGHLLAAPPAIHPLAPIDA